MPKKIALETLMSLNELQKWYMYMYVLIIFFLQYLYFKLHVFPILFQGLDFEWGAT